MTLRGFKELHTHTHIQEQAYKQKKRGKGIFWFVFHGVHFKPSQLWSRAEQKVASRHEEAEALVSSSSLRGMLDCGLLHLICPMTSARDERSSSLPTTITLHCAQHLLSQNIVSNFENSRLLILTISNRGGGNLPVSLSSTFDQKCNQIKPSSNKLYGKGMNWMYSPYCYKIRHVSLVGVSFNICTRKI